MKEPMSYKYCMKEMKNADREDGVVVNSTG